MLSHTEVKEIFEAVAPGLTVAERLVAQAISLHESSYGSGWKEGRGAGSHNFGAIMRPAGDDGPFFTTTDSKPGADGPVTFEGRFKIYPDDGAGALDVVRVALKDNVKDAANRGDLQGVAAGMFQNRYYTGTSQIPDVNIARYREALRGALNKILATTGENDPFPRVVASAAASSLLPSPSSVSSLPVLHEGNSGIAVSLCAAILHRLEGPGSTITPPANVFDARMTRAVMTFQGQNSLDKDGTVGPKTWARLIQRLFEPRMTGY